MRTLTAAVGLLVAVTVVITTHARADALADFYKGKQVTLIIGGGPGDGYDTHARLLARHMTRHIPGEPAMVPQNMPGAGSLTAVNTIYNVSPKDGTVIGTAQRFVTIMPLLGMDGVRFDATRLTYIGSTGKETTLCIAWRGSGFDSLDDVAKREMLIGTMGRGTELTNFSQTLSKTLGLKLKVISGYGSSAQINLAIERGELNGRCGVSYDSLRLTRQDWLDQKKIVPLVQIGLSRVPELGDTPFLLDLIAEGDEKSAVELLLAPSEASRPFFAPPGIPGDRADALRAAFDATMADPDFKADAAKTRLEITPASGADIQALVERIYRSSPAVVARARALAQE
ncbi:MAG: Bug family tripartite tricarboxylate transporter substrate binding protein [Gemmatimonas sp.]